MQLTIKKGQGTTKHSERYNELCSNEKSSLSSPSLAVSACLSVDRIYYRGFLFAAQCTRHHVDCLAIFAPPWNDHRFLGFRSRAYQRADYFLRLQLFFYPALLHTHRPPSYGCCHLGGLSDRRDRH